MYKEEIREKWWYSPTDIWFDTLEDVKTYLGNMDRVNEEIEKNNLHHMTYSGIVYLDKQDEED